MKKMLFPLFAAMLAVFIALPAAAAVDFNPATGTGFVGKGDVQDLFVELKNNALLQERAALVGFNVVQTYHYTVVCRFVTAEGKPGEKVHFVDQTKSADFNKTIEYDARTRKQITGFKLVGFGPFILSTPVPVEGDSCLGEGVNGAVSSVTLFGFETDLYASYGGVQKRLNWPIPVL